MSDCWVEMSLGGCCEVIKDSVDPASMPPDSRYVGMEHLDEGNPKVQRWASPNSVTSLVSRFKQTDSLFGRLRPYLRKVALANFDGVCSPEILVLRANQEVVTEGFLHLLASSDAAIEHSVAASAGSRMPRTSAQDLLSLKVHVPPLPVQRRIVDLMTHLDSHIANLRAETETAGRLLASIAEDWLSGSDIQPVPLGSVAQMYQPKTLAKSALVGSGPFPVFGANGLIGYHDEFNHAEEQVAVTCRGATCGRVNWTPANCWITGNAMVVRPNDEGALDRRFLYWALQYLTDLAVSVSGSAQPQITRASLSPVRLPVPARSEQERLANTLDALASQILRLEWELEALAGLRQTLLHVLLDGSVSIDTEVDALFAGVS